MVGITYLVLFAPLLLPKHCGLFRYIRDRTEDLVTEVHIEKGFKYIGMPVSLVLMSLGLETSSIVKIRRKAPIYCSCSEDYVSPSDDGKEDPVMENWKLKFHNLIYRKNLYRDRNAHLWGRRTVPRNLSECDKMSSNGEDGAQRTERCHSDVGTYFSGTGPNLIDTSHSKSDNMNIPQQPVKRMHSTSYKKARSLPSGKVERRHGDSVFQKESSLKADRNEERPPCIDTASLRTNGEVCNTLCSRRNTEECQDLQFSYTDVWPVSDDEILREGDVLFLSCGLPKLLEFQKQASSVLMLQGLRFIACDALDIPGKGTEYFEVVLSPQNHFVGLGGHRVPNFEHYYQCSVLALRKRGEIDPKPIHSPSHVYETPHRSAVLHKEQQDTTEGNRTSASESITQHFQHECNTPSVTNDGSNNTNIDSEDQSNIHARVEAMERPWEVGDVVLVFAKKDFDEIWKNTSEFLLISRVGNVPNRVTMWDYVPVFLFLAMLILVVANVMTMIKAAFCLSGIILILKFIVSIVSSSFLSHPPSPN